MGPDLGHYSSRVVLARDKQSVHIFCKVTFADEIALFKIFFFFWLGIYLRDSTCARHTVPTLAIIVFLVCNYIVRPIPVLVPFFVHVLPWNLDILLYFLWRLLLRVVSITMDTKTRSAARKYEILPFCKQHIRRISLNENFCMLFKFHWSLVLRVQLRIGHHWWR